LKGRICENLNAEIAIGTVNSVLDALGYMTWTFFARRLKANPSFYGAEAGTDEVVEQFLLTVVQETVENLKEFGCIDPATDDAVDSDLNATILGSAACKFYLLCGTPKQMQFGVREANKMILSCLEDENSGATQTPALSKIMPFERSTRVEEVSMGWLLYTLASTHEFDELPVRHNEEFLNEELSEELMWGPDTQSLLSGDKDQNINHNPEVFEDPHTK
jgi:activating signal cointegrator complex subunit 3